MDFKRAILSCDRPKKKCKSLSATKMRASLKKLEQDDPELAETMKQSDKTIFDFDVSSSEEEEEEGDSLTDEDSDDDDDDEDKSGSKPKKLKVRTLLKVFMEWGLGIYVECLP